MWKRSGPREARLRSTRRNGWLPSKVTAKRRKSWKRFCAKVAAASKPNGTPLCLRRKPDDAGRSQLARPASGWTTADFPSPALFIAGSYHRDFCAGHGHVLDKLSKGSFWHRDGGLYA